MKVKAIKDYFDLEMNRSVKELEEFEVSEARASVLAGSNNKAMQPLVEIIEEATTTPPEVVTEAEPPKKRGRKKNG